MTYRLYYTSADGPGAEAAWSVYREEYAHINAVEPIEDSTEKVSTHHSEVEAYDEAVRLQAGANA